MGRFALRGYFAATLLALSCCLAAAPCVPPKVNVGPGGLPLVKPPWGRIVAIDLNKGDSRSPLMVTKTLVFSADGNDLFNGVAGGGGNIFRAIDKKTGAVLDEMQLPAMATGIPMTYMVDGRQFIVVAVGATGVPAELVDFTAVTAVRKGVRRCPTA